MTELNAGQKHLVAEIDKYRNLLRDVARDIEDCKYNRKITHSSDFWPEPISEENWKWIAYQFVSTLQFNNVPNKLIAAVKATNRILVKLTESDGFDRFLEDETFCKEKIARLFDTNYLLDEFLHNKILKDEPSDKAKNKTDSRDPAREQKKEEQPKTKMSKSAHALAVIDGTKQTKIGQKDERNMLMIAARTSKEIWEDIKSEYGIRRPEFGKKINFVKDQFKRKIIFRDLEQAFLLASQGFSKPAIILAGGVIEELLRLYLDHKEIKITSDRFADYIKACENNNLLKRGVLRLSDSVRDFRNLVHLAKETEKKHTITMATAKGAVSSIFTIANDFQ